jgi:alpha-tubulin suppressor-like RCC1 family protein
MRAKLLPTIVLCLLLTGCGTLEVNIEYGWTPMPSSADSSQPAASPTAEQPSSTPSVTSSPPAGDTRTPTPTPIVPVALHAAAITSGEKHTCALTNLGGVNCWGNNEHGQLGDGSMVNSNVPVEVRGLKDVTAIAAGWAHTCALTRSGGVSCWGYNKNGELGNGKTVDSSMPVEVNGLSAGAVSIGTKEDHTCAVTTDGSVACWGYNEFGQLGDGTHISRSVPVEVQGLTGKAAVVAAGERHTCVITEPGGIQCWGNNELGQLGNGETAYERLSPVDVAGLTSGVIGISAAGNQTCALATGGAVSCWGNNKYGQLGDGTSELRRSPVAIDGLEQGVARVAAGWNHTCAVMGNGEVKCWGWNYYGQLGDETKATQSRPVSVRRLMEDAADVALGLAHTCAVTTAGGVKCWGANASGQLGDGTNLDSIVPLSIVGLRSTAAGGPVSEIKTRPLALGWNHACALTGGGGVKCWGDNAHGQLGDGTTAPRSAPVDVIGLGSGVVAVTAGIGHTCALTGAGGLKCWGENGSGGVGDGTTADRWKPVDVAGLGSGVLAVSAGGGFTCALVIPGAVKCWGYNKMGQLGDGTTEDRLTPVDVPGLGVGNLDISAGAGHACAVTAGGGVQCWGWNETGQLGDGKIISRGKPEWVAGVAGGIRGISAGAGHTCAMTIVGEVLCWGANGTAQLGDGTQGGTKAFAVTVAGLIGPVLQVSAGDTHTCALTARGAVKCWGWNGLGQLGDGKYFYDSGTNWSLTPVGASGLDGNIISISAGLNFSCAVTVAGGVRCWGRNDSGQLGDGTTETRFVPVAVIGF